MSKKTRRSQGNKNNTKVSERRLRNSIRQLQEQFFGKVLIGLENGLKELRADTRLCMWLSSKRAREIFTSR